MDSHAGRFRFPVRLAGCIASRILNDAADGRVAAVFRSSFYVETDAGFICIGNETLEPSPLNLITMAPAGTDWSASGLRRDAKISLSEKAIGVGNRFSFPWCDATNWSPQPVSKSWKPSDLECGLKVFRQVAMDHLPDEGLGRFLIPGVHPAVDEAVFRAAQTPVAEAHRWLAAAMRNPEKAAQDLDWVHPLIGLGPGLTPSGDDFIGGVMIALHGLDETGICVKLWALARRCAEIAGNPISYAHLSAASQGQGNAAVHRALAAIMEGRSEVIQNTLTGIDNIGHTSGWDAIAGVVTTFDAWLHAHRH